MTDFLKLLKEQGIAVAFAVVMLAVLLGWLPSPLLDAAQSAASMLSSHVLETSETTRILRVICRNSAKSAGTDPDRCDRGYRQDGR